MDPIIGFGSNQLKVKTRHGIFPLAVFLSFLERFNSDLFIFIWQIWEREYPVSCFFVFLCLQHIIMKIVSSMLLNINVKMNIYVINIKTFYSMLNIAVAITIHMINNHEIFNWFYKPSKYNDVWAFCYSANIDDLTTLSLCYQKYGSIYDWKCQCGNTYNHQYVYISVATRNGHIVVFKCRCM